jgi:hypothetical protein
MPCLSPTSHARSSSLASAIACNFCLAVGWSAQVIQPCYVHIQRLHRDFVSIVGVLCGIITHKAAFAVDRGYPFVIRMRLMMDGDWSLGS